MWEGFILHFHTDKYAGNFERQMCAWITGRVGECGVGQIYAEKALEDMSEELRDWTYNNVAQAQDESGCYGPVSISNTPDDLIPKWSCNTIDIYIAEKPSGDILEEIISRAKSFCSEVGSDPFSASKPGGKVCPLKILRVDVTEQRVIRSKPEIVKEFK